MPSVDARLYSIEEWKGTIDARLWGDGGSVAYERSIEGRVTAVEHTLRGADALADAARELRRNTARSWSRLEKLGLFAFAATTAASAVVTALYVIIG